MSPSRIARPARLLGLSPVKAPTMQSEGNPYLGFSMKIETYSNSLEDLGVQIHDLHVTQSFSVKNQGTCQMKTGSKSVD